jgi:hypothetical protein
LSNGGEGGGVSNRSWRNRIALAAILWLVACAGAWAWGMDPRPGLLALVIAAAGGMLWLFLDISEETEPVTWARPHDDPIRVAGEDPRLSLLKRVISGHLDAKDVDDQLHRHLAAVVDERLLARHGITRSASPERAAKVLGPDLCGLLAGPPTRRLSSGQIDRLLTRIEAL